MTILKTAFCIANTFHTTVGLKKKVRSGRPGQVDFPAGKVTFHSLLPNRQGVRQVICQLNNKNNPGLAQGKQNLRAACPKGKLGFNFFLSPDIYSASHLVIFSSPSSKNDKSISYM